MILEIEGHRFSTQKDAIKFVRDSIAANGYGEIWPGHALFKFMVSLCARHPELGARTPTGFRIQKNAFGQPELAALFGAEKVVFSYRTCVRGVSGKPRDLDRALRQAIVCDLPFGVGVNICGICNLEIMGGDTVQADHIIHFYKIKKAFIDSWAGELPVEFVKSRDRGGHIGFHRNDVRFEHAWREFHKKNAQLRIVHTLCNLRRGKKEDHELSL